MKIKKHEAMPWAVYFAIVTFLLIVIFIILNTVFLSRTIGKIEQKAAATPLEAEAVNELYGDFLRARTYLSISVDHDDIAAVEAEFFEMLGALSVGDTDGAAIAKNRLCGALGHLRRLSGFNIDSII